jgi:tripartite-type tricarboxylate transporter receptor subunit TctC
MRATQIWRPAHTLGALGAVGLALAAAAAGPVAAADLSGKRIEAIVPFGEGGGADTYTRYMVRYLEPSFDGDPTIVVRNIPGGGSVNGANWFAANAATDGTNFAIASTSTTLTYALRPDDPRVQFDPREWQVFIASPMGGWSMCTARPASKTSRISRTSTAPC